MITINLLPTQTRRNVSFNHQWAFPGQVSLACGILILTVITCSIVEQSLESRIHRLIDEQRTNERTLAKLKRDGEQIAHFERLRALLLSDDSLVKVPEERKLLPVIVLDVISKSLNPLDVWINRLSMSELDVSIEGRALANQEISRFMQNLEQSSVFGKLLTVETRIERTRNTPVHHFNLSFRLKA